MTGGQAPPSGIEGVRARYWHRLGDGRLQCDACPRECRLRDGQRGFCFVRGRRGGEVVLTAYGRSSGFCIDPVEKKPLAHFYPGSAVLSFGTAGCNLGCRFCQNWELSTSTRTQALAEEASPEAIARAAAERGTASVAFTYNDPVVFAEYAIDTALACHSRGVRTIAVSAGYVHGQARQDLFAVMDAANIDLKGFSGGFYRKLTGGQLATVLDTLVHLVHATATWVEITTMLIPGHNDSDAETRALTRWIAAELGPDVPLHFTAFHPAHRLTGVPRTPAGTLRRARRIGLEEGLRFVYTGNVIDSEGETTFCPGCGQPVIERIRYSITRYRLDGSGACDRCGYRLPGRFGTTAGDFGARRIPIRISAR